MFLAYLKQKGRAIFFIVIFFASLNFGFSQTYTDSNTSQKLEEAENINPQMLAVVGVEVNSNINFEAIRGNKIFLKQIGEFNSASVITQTSNSEINLFQEGNNNRTTLNYRSRTAYAEIAQVGNDNVIIDQFSAPNFDVSLELEQNGNNLNFIRDGVNDLTKTLRFTQTSASPSLIIRSFN